MLKEKKKGLFIARNNVCGKHLVIFSIPYNKNGYKINYLDSQNMKYNANDNTIHKNYNKWIANLEHNINFELYEYGLYSKDFDNSKK